MAGQGFNLGLRDAAMLAELIAAGGADPGAPQLLSRFADWRARDRSGVIRFTDGLVKLFGDRAARRRGAAQPRPAAVRSCAAGKARACASERRLWRADTASGARAGPRGRCAFVADAFDVVVVGGGPVGACAAALLAARSAAASRRRSASRFSSRTDPRIPRPMRPSICAWRRSRARASASWARPAPGEKIAAARISPYERMRIWHESVAAGERGALHFDAAEAGEPNLGYIIETRLVQAALLDAAAAAGARIYAERIRIPEKRSRARAHRKPAARR